MARLLSFAELPRHRLFQRGFSLVELIVVLVLIGIVAATVLPKMGQTGFDERGFRDRVVSGLRYAQKSAVAARRIVCVSFIGDTVQFSIAANFVDVNCATGSPLKGPDGADLTISGNGKAGFSGTPAAFQFDPAGRASSKSVISISNLPATLAITVEAETGYVH